MRFIDNNRKRYNTAALGGHNQKNKKKHKKTRTHPVGLGRQHADSVELGHQRGEKHKTNSGWMIMHGYGYGYQ